MRDITHHGITFILDATDWRSEAASDAAMEALIYGLRDLDEYATFKMARDLRRIEYSAIREDIETAALEAAIAAGGALDGVACLALPHVPVTTPEGEARAAEVASKRAETDAAKARFAEANGLTGRSNSAITKAWKRAGSPR